MNYKTRYDPTWARDLFLHNDDGLVHYREGSVTKLKMNKHVFRVWSNEVVDNAENYEPTWVGHVLYMRNVVFGPYEDYIV